MFAPSLSLRLLVSPLIVFVFSTLFSNELVSVTVYGTSTNMTVDNQDPRIVFSSVGWELQPDPQIGPAINGTVTLTRTFWSWFTFEFEGTAVYLVGDDHNKCWNFSAVIDDVIVASSFTGSDSDHAFVPYWGFEGLTPGVNHTLNITTLPNTTSVTNFIVDALLYTIEVETVTTTTTANDASTLSTTSAATSIPSQQASSQPSSHALSHIGPIVGGVVGGCVVFAIGLFVGIWFFSRRSRASLLSSSAEDSRTWPNTIPRPFPTPSTTLTNTNTNTNTNEAPSQLRLDDQFGNNAAPPKTLSSSTQQSQLSPCSQVTTTKPTVIPPAPAEPGGIEPNLSERIIREMSEIRAEIVRLRSSRRESGNGNGNESGFGSGSGSGLSTLLRSPGNVGVRDQFEVASEAEPLPSYDDVQHASSG